MTGPDDDGWREQDEPETADERAEWAAIETQEHQHELEHGPGGHE